jgi:hypothetical protein
MPNLFIRRCHSVSVKLSTGWLSPEMFLHLQVEIGFIFMLIRLVIFLCLAVLECRSDLFCVLV